jgi:hypothetical protein
VHVQYDATILTFVAAGTNTVTFILTERRYLTLPRHIPTLPLMSVRLLGTGHSIVIFPKLPTGVSQCRVRGKADMQDVIFNELTSRHFWLSSHWFNHERLFCQMGKTA